MREDFDFVTMENYAADMADLSSVAANAATKLRHDKDALFKVIVALIEANGGRISVPLHILARIDLNETELVVEQDDYANARIYRVRSRTTPDAKQP